MGNLLVASQVIIVLFLGWAYYQKDVTSTSMGRMARDFLTGKTKKGTGVELTKTGQGRKGSVFENSNPMFDK